MKEFQFKTNINCGGCIAKVTPFLNANTQINDWNVDTKNPQKLLIVKTEKLLKDDVKAIVAQAGFKAESLV